MSDTAPIDWPTLEELLDAGSGPEDYFGSGPEALSTEQLVAELKALKGWPTPLSWVSQRASLVADELRRRHG
jgi:hypothetical protein